MLGGMGGEYCVCALLPNKHKAHIYSTHHTRHTTDDSGLWTLGFTYLPVHEV